MGKYAVINPATGETVKEYPETQRRGALWAIAAATDAHRKWGKKTSVPERAALVKRVAELHPSAARRSPARRCREMGKPMDDALGEVDFSADIYGYYADHAEEFLADEPIALLDGEGSAVVRRATARRDPRDHAVELPGVPGRPASPAEPDGREHGRAQARATVPRLRARRPRRSSRTPDSRRAPTPTSMRRTSRSRSDRGPPGPGGVADRFGASRRRRRRNRRAPPEEGRARARRLRPVD